MVDFCPRLPVCVGDSVGPVTGEAGENLFSSLHTGGQEWGWGASGKEFPMEGTFFSHLDSRNRVNKISTVFLSTFSFLFLTLQKSVKHSKPWWVLFWKTER